MPRHAPDFRLGPPAPAYEPDSEFARDVVAGLTATPKRLPPKYFYDQRGSELFEAITAQPEYYPTRTETGILEARAADMARLLPQGAVLVEFGSGSSAKTRILLRALPLAAYVPVDISADFLMEEAARLRAEFPRLEVLPVAADFTKPFDLPEGVQGKPLVGFFPGSTIGNFEPAEAQAFLAQAGGILGRGSAFVLGVDLVKDPAVLDAAYNDAAGVTAAFNKNLLARINRELGADLDLDAFSHHAFYDADKQRVEMHLVSLIRQSVPVAGARIAFERGETIHTENSYKYRLDQARALARSAGWEPRLAWTDPRRWFSVHLLARAERDTLVLRG
jgi:L-histidine N-alpha-methyltransferase